MARKLFIPGPIDVMPDVLEKMATPMIGHRGKDASALQESVSKKLQKLFYTESEILLSTSSGSGLMEGAVRSCTSRKAAVFSCGAFGDRWYKMAVTNNVKADLYNVDMGKAITPEMVETALATGQYDFGAMRKAVDDTTRLVWICNPNNPTGTYESVEDIRNFISTLSKDVLVIIDEAYIDFVTSVEVPTARALLDEFPNVFIMRTFSKAYGLANYRVGYMMSSAELANYIQTIRLPYNLNTLSQVAAEAAFGDREFLRSTVEKNAAERVLWEQMLDEVGGTYYKSGANFIFMSVPNADGLADAWLAKGYQVRRGQRDNWLRVTLPPASDGAIMRAILKEYIARQ